MEDALLGFESFKHIALADPFFDSLKADYVEFTHWFNKKSDHHAYTFRNPLGFLEGFLYLTFMNLGDAPDDERNLRVEVPG